MNLLVIASVLLSLPGSIGAIYQIMSDEATTPRLIMVYFLILLLTAIPGVNLFMAFIIFYSFHFEKWWQRILAYDFWNKELFGPIKKG